MSFTITKRYENIPFAHRLHKHDGQCRFIHGHNWSVEFTFSASKRDDNGFILDFGKLEWIKTELEIFDHALVLAMGDPLLLDPTINTYARIVTVPDATTEGLAFFFFDRLNSRLKQRTWDRVWLTKVTVWEDNKNFASYEPAQ